MSCNNLYSNQFFFTDYWTRLTGLIGVPTSYILVLKILDVKTSTLSTESHRSKIDNSQNTLKVPALDESLQCTKTGPLLLASNS